MTRKFSTITLRHVPGAPGSLVGDVAHYMVVQVTDSVDFDPGQSVAKHEVRAMCKSPDWKVTIVGVGDAVSN